MDDTQAPIISHAKKRQEDKPPLNVHFYLTPNCNLACKHCYYDAWPMDRQPSRILSPQEVGRTIATICDRWNADFHVEGGEVFLRKDLSQIIGTIHASYWKSVTVTTNGTVPMNVPPEQLALIGNLRVSAESHQTSLQERIRGIPLDLVLATCAHLKEIGLPFEIRSTLMRANVEALPEMVRFFADHGATRMSFYEVQPVGRAAPQANHPALSPADAEVLFDTLPMIDLGGLDSLSFALAHRRAGDIQRFRHELDGAFQVLRLPVVPSLTINFDGALGVSPWKAHAAFLQDQFSSLDHTNLEEEIQSRFADGTLLNLCEHDTAWKLLARQPCSRNSED